MSKGTVRKVVEGDLNRILRWRNHVSIRQFMYSQHEITEDEHQSWFEQASTDDTRHLLIYEVDGNPLGFVNFNQHRSFPVADWGFYLAPDSPKGTGYHLGLSALDYAFGKVNLHKVCGEVLATNKRSIQYHFKLGFKQEGVLREQYPDNGSYHDVVCFGLLDHEWEHKVEGLNK